MTSVACWHHGDPKRLNRCLKAGLIDLYGPSVTTRKGTNRLQSWWCSRMRLSPGDRVRIAVKGMIVAEATIASTPYTLPPGVGIGIWGSAVNLKEVLRFDPPMAAPCYGHYQASHRL